MSDREEKKRETKRASERIFACFAVIPFSYSVISFIFFFFSLLSRGFFHLSFSRALLFSFSAPWCERVCFKFALTLWLTRPYFYIYKLHANVLTRSTILYIHRVWARVCARAYERSCRENEAINLNMNLHTILSTLWKQRKKP